VGIGATGHDEIDLSADEEVYDESTGIQLPAAAVAAARQEEVGFLKQFPVYKKVPRALSHGKEFVKVRWIDINKGDLDKPLVRSRLVAKEFRFLNPTMHGTFAGTPPIESFRFLLSFLVTIIWKNGKRLDIVMIVLDVSRAHFHPYAKREMYVELPAEDKFEADGDVVGLLLRTMYGTRDAANAFEGFANEVMEAAGFIVGASNPCLYRKPDNPCIGWRHGDDIVICGERCTALRAESVLIEKMLIKRKALLGWGDGDDRHAMLLNRLISVEFEDGRRSVMCEPDPRHIDLLLRMFSLDRGNSKGVVTPADKQQEYLDQSPLEGEFVVNFRSGTMRANYVAQDLPQVQYTVNKCARAMSCPVRGALLRLKRLARYLAHDRRVIQVFYEQELPRYLKLRVDSDWAGDILDRKSVGSLQVFWGGHCLRAAVATQTVQALSSGEAEFVAGVRGASVALGVRNIILDFGLEVQYVEMGTDSTASKGLCGRAGLGKIRHLDTGLLWIQHHVESRLLRLRKVKGTTNTADIGTKELSAPLMWQHLSAMGYQRRSGRHPLAYALTV